jgi:hypothetical protein
MPRGTSNKNETGNSWDRRVRKLWLLEEFGNGVQAPCMLRCAPGCLGTVALATITVDRILPGCEGGTYERSNIQPACAACNTLHGSLLGVARKAAKRCQRSDLPVSA